MMAVTIFDFIEKHRCKRNVLAATGLMLTLGSLLLGVNHFRSHQYASEFPSRLKMINKNMSEFTEHFENSQQKTNNFFVGHGLDLNANEFSNSFTSRILTGVNMEGYDVFEGNDDGNIDDFNRQDKICVNYIKKFISGATDTKDECEGVLNAYTAAECTQPIPISSRNLQSSTPSVLQTSSSPSYAPSVDDILIDDYIENWECCSSLHTFYSDHCRNLGDMTESLLGFVIVLVICVMVKSLVEKFKIHWLPQSAGCILVGAFVGGVMKLNKDDVDDVYFSENILMVVLLPPIVFSAALKLNKKAFRLHLIPILMYATIGTLLSAAMTGLTLFAITNADNEIEEIPILESLIFGALISSIDPVVILNILESAGIKDDDTLYIVLFGESILNDALAIVLFDTLVSYLRPDNRSLENPEILGAVSNFFIVLLGSLSVGLLSGVFSNMFFYYISGTQSAVVEVSIFCAWAMIPYYLCNMMDMSGIVALVAAGFFMDVFVIGSYRGETAEDIPSQNQSTEMVDLHMPDRTNYEEDLPYTGSPSENFQANTDETIGRRKLFSINGQLSEEAQKHTAFVAEVVSSVAETCIFAYLGAFLFSSNFMWTWKLNMSAIFACIGSRAVMIISVSLITNILEACGCGRLIQRTLGSCRRCFCRTVDSPPEEGADARSNSITKQITINCKMQLALIFAGLRGAVSLALVQSIPLYNTMTKTGTLFKAEMKSMTSTTIIFTVFIFGGMTHRFLGCLGFVHQSNQSGNSLERPLLSSSMT